MPLAQYGSIPPAVFVQQISERLTPAVLYLAAATGTGFGLGWLLAIGVVSGPFRRFVHHKWIYDIVDVDRRGGIVTAYVMTNIVDQARIIMYKGRLHDIFLGAEGKISYIILKDCTKYFMTFKDDKLITSEQYGLFAQQKNRPESVWDRLLIDGSNIANVLFDSSPEIRGQAEGAEALQAAFTEALARALREDDGVERLLHEFLVDVKRWSDSKGHLMAGLLLEFSRDGPRRDLRRSDTKYTHLGSVGEDR
jgi:hypothetical protein